MKTTLQIVLGAASFVALFNLSGCVTDILGVDTSDPVPWCQIDFEIQGPDEIFIDPGCAQEEVTYQLFDGGHLTEVFPGGAGWGFTWHVEGELDIVSASDPNPLIVLPPKEISDPKNGVFADISVTAENIYEECGTEGETTVYASKKVGIFLNVLDVTSTVCSVNGSLGAGQLEVQDKALGQKNYQWTIFPADAAIITPVPGTNRCDVKDAKSDFQVRVEKFGNGCVNEVYKDIVICIK